MSQIAPDAWVAGQLAKEDLAKLKEVGVSCLVCLSPEAALNDLHAAAVEQDVYFYQLPIQSAQDLNQLNIMNLDKFVRMHFGETSLIFSHSRELPAAAWALRMGWLRGRKMDLCLEAAKQNGVGELLSELNMRLLVPR